MFGKTQRIKQTVVSRSIIGVCTDYTDDIELEIGLARLEDLMARRPLLLNSVLLRQNPHNVLEWHKRVKLYEGKPREVCAYKKYNKTV